MNRQMERERSQVGGTVIRTNINKGGRSLSLQVIDKHGYCVRVEVKNTETCLQKGCDLSFYAKATLSHATASSVLTNQRTRAVIRVPSGSPCLLPPLLTHTQCFSSFCLSHSFLFFPFLSSFTHTLWLLALSTPPAKTQTPVQCLLFTFAQLRTLLQFICSRIFQQDRELVATWGQVVAPYLITGTKT